MGGLKLLQKKYHYIFHLKAGRFPFTVKKTVQVLQRKAIGMVLDEYISQ